MKTLILGRYALRVCVTATLLVGCAGSQSAMGIYGAEPQSPRKLLDVPSGVPNLQSLTRTRYKSIYDFQGTGGSSPWAGLTPLNGVLYGTLGTGSVFEISTSGDERVVYQFMGSGDNRLWSDLVAVNGTLYGTNYLGGSGGPGCSTGCGYIFSVTTSGKEQTLYNFRGGTDGANPYGGLTLMKGELYGTTISGGGTGCGQRGHAGPGCGTVFKVSTSGAEQVLYSFDNGGGASPSADLLALNGKLYGTTSRGHGTVFQVTTSGRERTLYSFKGREAEPLGGLTAKDGVLYGTTNGGQFGSLGSVFELSMSGKEKVLHYFTGGMDGANPDSEKLVFVKGELYGTTMAGGCCSPYGSGTIFKVSESGKEHVLYRFKGGTDGAVPRAGLVGVNGKLYGTTSAGGYASGDGTVFRITP